MPKYNVAIERNTYPSVERFDGGFTLNDARETAQYYANNTPYHARVYIEVVWGVVGPRVVEVVKETDCADRKRLVQEITAIEKKLGGYGYL